MNAIIDANVIIAAFHKGDENAPQGSEILKKFREGAITRLYTTSYVMIEAVNFLIRKAPFSIARDVYKFFTQTERLTLLYMDSSQEFSIRDKFLKYESLSITDCSLLAIAEEMEINTIYSFDSGFDKVKRILRLEQ